MKQTFYLRRFYLLIFMLIAMTMGAKAESVPYAELDVTTKTLYFRYGEMPSSNAWDASDTGYSPGWSGYISNVEKVIIDESFAAARPKSCARWFKVQDGIGGKITNVEGLQYLNTSEVTNMACMFQNSDVENIDLSNFDTSKVTNMSYMFSGCNLLASLDLNSFNTSKVTNMSYMFSECYKLTSLDVSSFNTSNVTNMSYMFNRCNLLASLDVSRFNTSKVTNMSYMFDCCLLLANLDVSSFNTSNVTNMSWMFFRCENLTSLDVSNFDTSKVTNMSGMFYWCENLTSLDVSSFNTSNVTDMSYMFRGSSSLETLDVSSFNTSNVTNMSYMFSECTQLTSLDVSSFNTSNVTNMSYMFSECYKLTTIYCNETWTCSSSEYMFSGCNNLKGSVSWESVSGDGDISWENKTNCTYANPETGYFTKKNSLDVCGVMVTPTNCDDLTVIDGVSGTVSYDYTTNTLYLKNATITSSVYQTGIKAYYDENRPTLNLNVEGECTVSTPNVQPVFTQRKQLNITGDGILNLSGSQGIYTDLEETHRITVKDNVTVNIDATVYGIRGCVANSTYYTTLAVEENAILNVKGTTQDLYNIAALECGTNVRITSPSRTIFNQTMHTATTYNTPVANQILTICAPRYDLWVFGQQFSMNNASTGIAGSQGVATYDATTNTLTLDNYNDGGTEPAVKCDIEGLTIKAIGNNILSSSDGGIVYSKQNLTITGDTLNVLTTYNTLCMTSGSNNTVNIDNCKLCGFTSLSSSGLISLVGGYVLNKTALRISGSETNVEILGNSTAVSGIREVTLNDGLAVISPTGVEYADRTYKDADGNAVKGLVFGLLGDANSDGSITMADANLIVNYFLATDKKTVTGIDLNKANANGDTQDDGSPSITMADANQIVNMFLNGGK